MSVGTVCVTPRAQSLGELLEEGAAALRSSLLPQEDGAFRRESAVLLREATGMSATDLLAHRNAKVAGADAARFREWIDARARGVPLQHLIGRTGFHAIELRIEPGVFIPRPETELLVELALAEVSTRASTVTSTGAWLQDRACILDLCTGSGAVAVAIAHALTVRNLAARVYAGDRDSAAVDLARRNAMQLGLIARVDVRESDLAEGFADLAGQVDILTANPPYIDPACAHSLPFDVRFGDPPQALFDPEGGTGFHQRIADQGRTLLRDGGTMFLEIGEDQGARVARILQDCGYADVQILPDLAGRDRIARGRWSPSTPSS